MTSTCAEYVTALVPITVPEQFVSFRSGILPESGTVNDPPISPSGSFTESENVTCTVVLVVSRTAAPLAGETKNGQDPVSTDEPFEIANA